MRILIAVTSFLSYRLIEGQIRYLTSKGAEVYFSSTHDDRIKEAIEKEGGIYCPLEIEREISFFKDFKSIFQTYKLLRKIKPDILNVSTPKASLVFSLASLFYRKSKIIFTLRGLRSDTLNGVKYRIVKFTEYLCCQIADKVIVISPSLRDYAVSTGILRKSKSIVIGHGSSNGVNIERFTLDSSKLLFGTSFRKDYEINTGDVVFGYVGRLVKDKGVEELYDSFRKIKQDYPRTFLLLVGTFEAGDPLTSNLVEAIEKDKNIIVLDYMEQIENIFPAMDCFVLYSYREGFGNVSIEAAAMGLPVIVADIPGLKDTIVDNETGLLSEPRNSEDLYYKMLCLLRDEEKRKIMGKNGRNRVVKYFDRIHIWEGQYIVYKNVLDC